MHVFSSYTVVRHIAIVIVIRGWSREEKILTDEPKQILKLLSRYYVP
jgi:hypothetical protein